MYMGGCVGSQGEEYWPYEVLVLVMWLQWWLGSAVDTATWISHKVLRLLKKAAFDTSRETPQAPKWGKAPERN